MDGPTSAFRAARNFLLATADDYRTATTQFVPPRFTEFNWALDWFDAVLATEHADDRALWIVDGDQEASWTFAELSARSNQVANRLRADGVRRGDRVLVQLGNQVELWETLLALMKLGAVAVPTSPLLFPADVAARAARVGARHVVTRPVGRSSDRTFDPDGPTRADDPLLILVTPGTTGAAKAIVHTHTSFPAGHLATMYWAGLRPGDVHLSVSTPGWAEHLCGNLFTPWNAGACVLACAAPDPSPGTLLSLVARCRVTTMCAPPKAWRTIAATPDLASRRPRLSALRELLTTSEPVSPDTVHRIRRALGRTIREGYGQSETTALVGHSPGGPVTLGAMGRPLPGCPVVLVDPVSGYPAAPGEEGEICLDLVRRPPGLMAHYLDASQPLPVRYYRTGDVAVADELGYLRYLGRLDDVFTSADRRISPVELEGVLLEHEAVGEAAVVPADALPKAYVDLTPGHPAGPETARAILRHARSHLPPYQCVHRVEFGALPRTVSGRVRRAELRARESAGCRRAHEYRLEDFPEFAGEVYGRGRAR